MTYCMGCGTQLPEGASFCPSCGQAAGTARSQPVRQELERPLVRTWLFVTLLALVGIVGVAFFVGTDQLGRERSTPTPEARLYSKRVDSQREDVEVRVGDPAVIDGVRATVKTAKFQSAMSEFETKGYIVATIGLANEDTKTHSYNELHWRIQMPDGRVLDEQVFSMTDGKLASGDIVAGGKADGVVAFEVGGARGEFYLIWKPNPYDAARGIWGFRI
jgi:hypothetical protein